jgi:hypothetical protein
MQRRGLTDRCGCVACRADQWDAQATVKRMNESLIARGYLTWFDLTNMKGEQRCLLHPFAALQQSALRLLIVMQAVLWMP